MPNNRFRIPSLQPAAYAPAASRASWIGTIQIDDFSIPVKAYSAIASPESHLNLIHASCGRRVSLRKVCPKHGMLEPDETQKAFAYSPDILVELPDDELKQLNPVDDKTIVIERFFSPDRLDPTLLAGRTLSLAPANLAAHHPFRLLKAALESKQVWALGRTVLSQKRQLVVIHSHDESLLLHTLHDPSLRRLPMPDQLYGKSPYRTIQSAYIIQIVFLIGQAHGWTPPPFAVGQSISATDARALAKILSESKVSDGQPPPGLDELEKLLV